MSGKNKKVALKAQLTREEGAGVCNFMSAETGREFQNYNDSYILYISGWVKQESKVQRVARQHVEAGVSPAQISTTYEK